MTPRRVGSILLLILVLIVPSVIQASAAVARGDTIAVMDLKPNGTSASEAAVVSDYLRTAFVKSGRYTVVDKGNMEKVISEQSFQQAGCADQACAVRLGRLLNVKKMVVGSYTVLGSSRFLTASLVDVETGVIDSTGTGRGFDLAGADVAAERLVAKLTGKPASAVVVAESSPEPTTPARSEPGRIGFGLNSPGVGLRYRFNGQWQLEARGQYQKEAQTVGSRLYAKFSSSGAIQPYLGLEGDYVMYKGEESLKVNGFAGELFAGVEYFLWPTFSFQFDGGAAFVSLAKGDLKGSEVRFVVDFGLTKYF